MKVKLKINRPVFKIVSFLLSSICSVLFIGANGSHDYSHETVVFDDFIGTIEERGQLIHDLFHNYDQRNYPVNVSLQLGLSLITLEVDPFPLKRNLFHADVLLRYFWNDPRLKWDSEMYGGHRMLSVPAFQVWKPDIRLLNSAIRPHFQPCHESNVLISSTGDVTWVSPCLFSAHCNQSLSGSAGETNGTTRMCPLTFGSWSWDGCPLDLQLHKDKKEADLTFFHDVTPWNVTKTKATRTEKHEKEFLEKYPIQITFEFHVKRKNPLHHPPYFIPHGPGFYYPFHY